MLEKASSEDARNLSFGSLGKGPLLSRRLLGAEDEVEQGLTYANRVPRRHDPDGRPVLLYHREMTHILLHHPLDSCEDALVGSGHDGRLRHYSRDGHLPAHERLRNREDNVARCDYAGHLAFLVDHY